MLRLAHRILAQKPPVFPPSVDPGYMDTYLNNLSILKKCPIIVANNVAEYDGTHTYEIGDGTRVRTCAAEKFSFTGENYPCIAPPFNGHWFIEFDAQATFGEQWLQRGTLFTDMPLDAAKEHAEECGIVDLPFDKARWCLKTSHYYTLGGPTAGCLAGTTMMWPAEDHILVGLSGEFLDGFESIWNIGQTECLDTSGLTFTFLRVPLLAMGYMHCSNIGRLDATEVMSPGAKWCRRKRVPELRYQVLKIGTPGGKRPSGRLTEGDRSGKALHICRGSFAHYKKENGGLFGRGKDETIWRPAHARGSKEHGEIRSTYEMGVPA